MIRLVDVDQYNWRTELKVAEQQKHYVADSAHILARAYAYREQRSRAFVVYNEDIPVGMGLYYDLPELDCYDFSQIFIDEKYQCRGYGKDAVKAVLDAMKMDGKYNRVILCFVEGNDAARMLYEKFGFSVIDHDGDEIIMDLNFDKCSL